MRHLIKYFLIALISLWILGFWYILFTGRTRSGDAGQKGNDGDDLNDTGVESKVKLLKRLQQAEKKLTELERENRKNERLILDLKTQSVKYIDAINSIAKDHPSVAAVVEKPDLKETPASLRSADGPSELFENTRRKLFHDLKDVNYFVNDQLNIALKAKDLTLANKRINFIKQDFQSRINILTATVYNLSVSDDMGRWRDQQFRDLTSQMNEHILRLQNPSDCDKAKKIVCDLNKACGFGCQMHHVMYCFITSFFLNRTLILESSGWRYNSAGATAYFKPMSDSCTSVSSTDKVVGWNDQNVETSQAVKMPIIDVLSSRPRFLPLSIPKQYSEALLKFHGDPFVWFSGQLLNFLMRFNDDFSKTVSIKRKALGFETPCVGVHVRRTDKVGAEADFHGVDEYMKHVEDFYDIADLRNGKPVKRVVFLASDEVGVLKEAKQKYPNYKFVYDEENAKTASLSERYTPQSAQGVILDIHFLSQCDYLVCTFSSQVCRMAYELMQARFPDASWRFKSLDDVYYFGGQNGHRMMAAYDHKPNREMGEIELKVGDTVGLAGNHWNGYSKVRNFRTNEDGLAPSYKLKDIVEIV